MSKWKKVLFPTPPGWTEEQNEAAIEAFGKVVLFVIMVMIATFIAGVLGA